MNFRYVSLFMLLCLSGLSASFAQISTIKPVEPRKPAAQVRNYDSTRNFLGEDVYQYAGQELYLKGKAQSLREYGYSYFYSDSNCRNKYKCCQSYNSIYDSLAERYFQVLDVKRHPKAEEMSSLYGDTYILKLRERKHGDTVYYEYSTQFEHSFPFIVVGYIEKIKQQLTGKKYIFQDAAHHFDKYAYDLYTGDTIIHKLSDIWTITDVAVEQKYYELEIVFRNEKGQHCSDGLDNMISPTGATNGGCYTVAEAARLKAKYGAANWELILKRKVQLGMTKEMCKLSWGESNKVNRTIVKGASTEQWVFDDNYLYFNGNKLTGIQ